MIPPTLQTKIRSVEQSLASHAPLLVAYSGGVDSACLLALAHRTLGSKTLGVIADSPSLPRSALANALQIAKDLGAAVEVVKTAEFANSAYTANPVNRCFFCKAELFRVMEDMAINYGFSALAYGENADDVAGQRPGSEAARQYAVLAPLREAGMGKAEVREVARELGLRCHDAPAQPCLSSRIPHGVPVTVEAVKLVERGEEGLRAMGFRILRVRLADAGIPRAWVQVGPGEVEKLLSARSEVERVLREAGFAEVGLDPTGYRGAGLA